MKRGTSFRAYVFGALFLAAVSVAAYQMEKPTHASSPTNVYSLGTTLTANTIVVRGADTSECKKIITHTNFGPPIYLGLNGAKMVRFEMFFQGDTARTILRGDSKLMHSLGSRKSYVFVWKKDKGETLLERATPVDSCQK